jgi:A/G-specific adenine glycosylase
MLKSRLSSRLLGWYGQHARALPWRDRRDPYRIWISEIMLQQTRVEAVIPYFERWIRRFPTVRALAASSERDVLAAWEGLGYYARARNLRSASRRLLHDFDGRLPADLNALRSLPGIGRYTAGAIASIAFGIDAPALDGNIRRVLARVFNVGARADSAAGRAKLWHLAEVHLPKGRAGDYNQALMDLGATVCLPRQPRCPTCPVRGMCEARKLGTVNRRPVMRTKKPPPLYLLGAAVVTRRGRVLLAQRAPGGLLGGMWEFPNVRLGRRASSGRRIRPPLESALERAYGLKVRLDGTLCVIQHAYTHFRVSVEAHACELISASQSPRVRWVKITELPRYPMGKVDRRIALRMISQVSWKPALMSERVTLEG